MSDTGAGFCPQCGSPVRPGGAFCTKCGAQVGPAPAPSAPAAPPQPPAPMYVPAPAPAPGPAPDATGAERVVSIIPNAMLKSGFMGIGSKPYTIVLTNRRMIFARITNDMMKQLVVDARDEAKSQGKGFFGQWGAQLSAYSRFAQRYLELPPEATLHEVPDNFAIENSTIQKTKLKAGYAGDSDTPSQPDRLIIKTTDKKYDVTLNAGTGQAREALVAAALI